MAKCDEVAAYGGGALVRQDTQLHYTAIQAALDGCFPYDKNYWDKGVFINWDPNNASEIHQIVDTVTKAWADRPAFATKLSTFILLVEVNGAVAEANPNSTSFSARGGRLWATALIGWPDDDDVQRAASKQWCDQMVSALNRFHVTTYANNAMPSSDKEMRAVFPGETMSRLQTLKQKSDPDGMFRTGIWDYQANL